MIMPRFCRGAALLLLPVLVKCLALPHNGAGLTSYSDSLSSETEEYRYGGVHTFFEHGIRLEIARIFGKLTNLYRCQFPFYQVHDSMSELFRGGEGTPRTRSTVEESDPLEKSPF